MANNCWASYQAMLTRGWLRPGLDAAIWLP